MKKLLTISSLLGLFVAGSAQAAVDLTATATSIVTDVGAAITAGLLIFAAVAGIRYILKAFRAASKG